MPKSDGPDKADTPDVSAPLGVTSQAPQPAPTPPAPYSRPDIGIFAFAASSGFTFDSNSC